MGDLLEEKNTRLLFLNFPRQFLSIDFKLTHFFHFIFSLLFFEIVRVTFPSKSPLKPGDPLGDVNKSSLHNGSSPE